MKNTTKKAKVSSSMPAAKPGKTIAVTLHLDPKLIAQTEAFAAAHNFTLSELITLIL